MSIVQHVVLIIHIWQLCQLNFYYIWSNEVAPRATQTDGYGACCRLATTSVHSFAQFTAFAQFFFNSSHFHHILNSSAILFTTPPAVGLPISTQAHHVRELGGMCFYIRHLYIVHVLLHCVSAPKWEHAFGWICFTTLCNIRMWVTTRWRHYYSPAVARESSQVQSAAYHWLDIHCWG